MEGGLRLLNVGGGVLEEGVDCDGGEEDGDVGEDGVWGGKDEFEDVGVEVKLVLIGKDDLNECIGIEEILFYLIGIEK